MHSRYFGILQENTLKRLQGNLIKTIMVIFKNCRTTPLLKALNLCHIPSIDACFNLKLLKTVMKRNFATRQFNLLMIKATVIVV